MLGDLRDVLAPPWSEIALVLAAFVCGGIVGAERERHDKPAGLRTLVLICVGSTLFTLVSRAPALAGDEPGRIAAQIVTGVGFLGAGSILRERFGIKGLTTAATVWTTAALGIAVGAGYAAGGIVMSITIALTLSAFKRLEDRMAGACQLRRVRIVYRPDGGKTRARLQAAIEESGTTVLGLAQDRPDGSSEAILTHCVAHRDHRFRLAAVAELEAVQTIEPSGD